MFSDYKRFIYSLGVAQLLFVTAQATSYIFTPEHEDVVTPCSGPDYELFDKLFDRSNLVLEYDDELVKVSGFVKFNWKSEPGDNVDLTVSVLKKKGSDYVPTFMMINRRDGCSSFFNPNEMWYDSFTSHVVKEDQVCITDHHEVIWHFEPFEVSLTMNMDGISSEGFYKIVLRGKSYDKEGKYNDNNICFEILCHLQPE